MKLISLSIDFCEVLLHLKAFTLQKLKNMNETYFFINRFLWSVALLCCCCCGCGGFTVVRMMGWVEVEWLVCRWRQVVCVHACKQFDCFLLVTCELGYNKPAATMKFVHSWTGWNEYNFNNKTLKVQWEPAPLCRYQKPFSKEEWYEWWVWLHKEVLWSGCDSELWWHCMPKSFNSDFGKHESFFFPHTVYMKHSFAFCHAHVQFNSSIR